MGYVSFPKFGEMPYNQTHDYFKSEMHEESHSLVNMKSINNLTSVSSHQVLPPMEFSSSFQSFLDLGTVDK